MQPALAVSMLSRPDNYTMVLSVPPLPEYQLVAPSETVHIHLPSELLASDQSLDAPPLKIIRSTSVPLRISLVKDSWQREVGAEDLSSTALLAGLRSMPSSKNVAQTKGWNGPLPANRPALPKSTFFPHANARSLSQRA